MSYREVTVIAHIFVKEKNRSTSIAPDRRAEQESEAKTYGENSAWMMAYANKDTAFEKNGAHNLDTRILFHFGYIVVSPAMAVTVAGKGSDYALIALDAKKQSLDGSKTYKLHLPPNVSAKDGLLGPAPRFTLFEFG